MTIYDMFSGDCAPPVGDDHLFPDYLTNEIGSPANKAVIHRQYFQNLRDHGVPADLAEAVAKLIADPTLEDSDHTLFKLALHFACKPDSHG